MSAPSLRAIISEPLISEGKLRNVAAAGIPDNHGLRGVVWRILLRYLPLETALWPAVLHEKRSAYAMYKQQYFHRSPLIEDGIDVHGEAVLRAQDIIDPSNPRTYMGRFIDGTLKGLPSIDEYQEPVEDEGERGYNRKIEELQYDRAKEYLENLELLEAIMKDVSRTYPDIRWFNGEDAQIIQTALINVLFIYAKRNEAVRYVQGMNEVLGTLYFVFGSDEDVAWREHAEADVYFCFEVLMTEIADLFIQNMDNTASGLQGRMKGFISLLERHDKELYDVLQMQGIQPSFYSVRWLTTLLSREFNLADTVRLWDSLFADTDRHPFLSYMCCAMLMDLREDLLKGDFSENLCLLQSYPQSSSCESLLSVANKLRTEDIVLSKFKYQEELEPEPSTADRVLSAVFEWSSSARRSFIRSTEQMRTILFDETPSNSSRVSPSTTVDGTTSNMMSPSERTKAATGFAPFSLAEGVFIFTNNSADCSSRSSSSSLILSTEAESMGRDKVLVEEADILSVIDGGDAMIGGGKIREYQNEGNRGPDMDGFVEHNKIYDEQDVVEEDA